MTNGTKTAAATLLLTLLLGSCGVEVHNESPHRSSSRLPNYLRYTVSERDSSRSADDVLATDCINIEDGSLESGSIQIDESDLRDDVTFLWTLHRHDTITIEFLQSGDTITSSTYDTDYFQLNSVAQQVRTQEGVEFSFDLRSAGSHCR